MSVEAERAVVGACLRSETTAVEMIARLPVDAFTDPLCVAAWHAIGEAIEAGAPTDVVSISSRVAAVGKGNLANPSVPLFELAEAAIEGQAPWHATLIEEAWARRRAGQIAQRFLQHLESTQDLPGLLEHLRDQIDTIGGAPATLVDAATMFHAVLTRASEGVDDTTIIDTGWSDVDDLVRLRAGQLVVVAARPSVGKSTVLGEIARHVALAGKTVVVASLEMTHDEVGTKMYAAHTRINAKALADARLDDADWRRLAEAAPALTGLPLYVEDGPRTTLAQIRAHARRYQPALIVVDYLQQVHVPGATSRQEAVAAVSRGLKVLAKECGCVIIAAAQLNRDANQRHSKTPVLSDLRESGQIEADADTVILLHREDLIERESPRAGEIDLIIAKQRGGSTGTITLGFDGARSRLVQLTFDYQTGEYVDGRYRQTA